MFLHIFDTYDTEKWQKWRIENQLPYQNCRVDILKRSTTQDYMLLANVRGIMTVV